MELRKDGNVDAGRLSVNLQVERKYTSLGQTMCLFQCSHVRKAL